MQDAESMKVFVLGHDHESAVSGMGPDCMVGDERQADVADMEGTGIHVTKSPDKASREILVEKQPGGLLRQPGYSRPGAPARQRTLGRHGCRRA
jgi:hypothetical protein